MSVWLIRDDVMSSAPALLSKVYFILTYLPFVVNKYVIFMSVSWDSISHLFIAFVKYYDVSYSWLILGIHLKTIIYSTLKRVQSH